MMFRITAIVALAVALALTMIAPARAQDTINPADFSTTITNPYYPLSTLAQQVYEGEETDLDTDETIETRGVITLLPQMQKTVAGVSVLVVRDEAFVDGELVESTLDYYAQHRDGTVYYFGEDVDNYEDGVVVDHDGSWLAGEGQNLPGIFMPATPAVGATFDQERAPGIAEDTSTILQIGLSVTTPAGTFTGCIKTEDLDPLADATENKWYCRDVGLVKEEAEDELSELVSFTKAPAPAPTAAPSATAPAGVAQPAATQPSGVTIAAPSTGSGPGGSGSHEALILTASAILLVLGAGSIAARAIVVRRHR